MYCHKCGNKLPDQAGFCPVCGTKVNRGEEASPKTDTIPQERSDTTQETTPKSHSDDMDFMAFVNHHVRSTTSFQSADALLSSRVSATILWACLLGPAIILALLAFIISGKPGPAMVFALLGLAIGFFAAYVVGWNERRKISNKYANTYTEALDTEDLATFLTENLHAISPMFHEWTQIREEGLSVAGVISAEAVNSMQDSCKEVTLGSPLGLSTSSSYLAMITVGPCLSDPDSGLMRYAPNVEHRIVGFMSFKKYTLLVKTAPILQAAMEYYLAANRKGGEIASAKSVIQASDRDLVSQDSCGGKPEEVRPVRKKSRKGLIAILLAALLVVAAGAFIAMNWSRMDYVASIKSYQPFAVSQNLPYTCGEVLDKYLVSSQWKELEPKGDLHYVEISGTAKGTEQELIFVFQIAPNPNDPDGALYVPYRASIDGVETSDSGEITDFLGMIFTAYDQNWEDISVLLAGNEVELSQTFTDEAAGISFQYPVDWVILEPDGESDIVNLVDSSNTADNNASIEIFTALDPNPFGVMTDDPATVKEAVNEFHTFISLANTTIDDVPAMELVYETPGLSGNDIVSNYLYTNGNETYQIICSTSESSSMKNSYIFDAILDSYTISPPAVPAEPEESVAEPEAPTMSDGKLYYYGVSLTELLGHPITDLNNIFGAPTSGTPVDGSLYSGGEFYSYGDIAFVADDTGTIAWVMGTPSAVEINGVTLDKTRDELTQVIGEPISEQPGYNEMTDASYYSVQYLLSDGGVLLVEMESLNSPASYFTLG